MKLTNPITETELRQAMRRELRGRVDRQDGTALWEEFALERGSARIDLAMLTGQLEGFELKSDLDSFKRLADQMHAYNRVFDRITLVTGTLFEEPARALMPQWWGLVVAERDAASEVVLNPVRAPEHNPVQDAHSLAMLLWREEAMQILALENIPAPRASSRAQLYDRLAAMIPIVRLRAHVIRSLRARAVHSARAVSTR